MTKRNFVLNAAIKAVGLMKGLSAFIRALLAVALIWAVWINMKHDILSKAELWIGLAVLSIVTAGSLKLFKFCTTRAISASYFILTFVSFYVISITASHIQPIAQQVFSEQCCIEAAEVTDDWILAGLPRSNNIRSDKMLMKQPTSASASYWLQINKMHRSLWREICLLLCLAQCSYLGLKLVLIEIDS